MTEIEMRTVVVDGLSLHVAEAGPADGPLVILLHGFPEFWFEWREQIGPLAQAGFRVVAPDQRGYNLSGKPKGVDSYRLDRLADDIFALATALGRRSFQLVGHDWGASVAWWMATRNPGAIERMAILNAPHPAVWRHAMTADPAQRKKSSYVRLIHQAPWLVELLIRAGGFRGLAQGFEASARPEAFGPEVMAQYRAAWRRPGALAATLSWYCALFIQELPVPAPGSLQTPTLVLWGDRDAFAEPGLAEESAALCAEARVVHFPNATHWLPHDEPSAVVEQLLDFLRR